MRTKARTNKWQCEEREKGKAKIDHETNQKIQSEPKIQQNRTEEKKNLKTTRRTRTTIVYRRNCACVLH